MRDYYYYYTRCSAFVYEERIQRFCSLRLWFFDVLLYGTWLLYDEEKPKKKKLHILNKLMIPAVRHVFVTLTHPGWYKSPF